MIYGPCGRACSRSPRRRHSGAWIPWMSGAGFLLACSSSPEFQSPVVPQGPPRFVGPQSAASTATTALLDGGPAIPNVAPSALSFFRSQDSDEWVRHEFVVQKAYERVIVVCTATPPPASIAVDPIDLNALPGDAHPKDARVDLAVTSLQEAANAARGGDLIAVLPGRYRGFTLGPSPGAGDGRYIHFKAYGAPGEVVVDAPSPADAHWNVVFEAAHHVILQGFNLKGANTPEVRELTGTNAGILIDGRFGETSKLAHHIAILGNYSHHHWRWGIHSVDSHTVLVQDNLFANSAKEHGAYFSDGSDNYVIRRNVFYGNAASGLQINADPKASLEKLARHPALVLPPIQPTRDWALQALRVATDRFGANAFPDGRGFNFLVEANVMNRNGRLGGAALNLAGVRESVFQNNLIYDNASSGIAEWDNANPFDAATVTPGPQAPGDITGADSLPIFGCFNNLIENNTVLSAVKGRPAFLAGNGSWGSRVFNNVLVNDEFPSVEVSATSIWRFDAANNVLDGVSYEGAAGRLKALAFSLPDGAHSATGVTRRALAAHFVRANDEPWVVLEASWWRLSPQRPDFHPRATGVLLPRRGRAQLTPKTDLEGKARVSADIGAYVSAAP